MYLHCFLPHFAFFLLNLIFFAFFFRICLAPSFNTMNSKILFGRVYLKILGVWGLFFKQAVSLFLKVLVKFKYIRISAVEILSRRANLLHNS